MTAAHAAPPATHHDPRKPHHPWWPWVRRAAALVFFAGVVLLLARQARTIDWNEVLAAVAELPRLTLLEAGIVAACSFALYSTYDLLGRHLTGHRLGTATVMGVTFISYAFNLSLGSMVGGIAFRFRMYSRLGLRAATITRVLGTSLVTNWTGYLLIAGVAYLLWPLGLPPTWKIDNWGVRVLGAVFIALAAGYVALCAWAHERTLHVRGHDLQPPPPRIALLQLAMAFTNWALVACVIWVLLQGQVTYVRVLAVFLVSVMAGLIVRIPAGLGVLEAVFVALLGDDVGAGRLLAALLAYRGIYYLVPLAIAAVAFLGTEWRARRLRRRAAFAAAVKQASPGGTPGPATSSHDKPVG